MSSTDPKGRKLSIVRPERKALTDKEERNVTVGATCVKNGEWEEARLHRNSQGKIVVSQVDFPERIV